MIKRPPLPNFHYDPNFWDPWYVKALHYLALTGMVFYALVYIPVRCLYEGFQNGVMALVATFLIFWLPIYLIMQYW